LLEPALQVSSNSRIVHARDGSSTVCRIIIKSDKCRLRDVSARTIRDTRTRIRGRNLIRSAAVKADTRTEPVDIQKERERERGGGMGRRRERSRKTILFPAMPRCLVSRGKNYGPTLREERSQIMEIIPRLSSPLSLSPAGCPGHDLRSRLSAMSARTARAPLPRRIPAGKLCAKFRRFAARRLFTRDETREFRSYINEPN